MNNYKLLPKVVLRTPLLPVNGILKAIRQADTLDKQESLVVMAFQNPVLQEALFLASPNLYQQFEKLTGGTLKKEKEKKRVYLALFKYLIRMSVRSTPFGLFAGCMVYDWADHTRIELADLPEWGRRTRLDMQFCCELSEQLSAHPEIRDNLVFFPNTSAYPFGDQVRYVEYFYEHGFRKYQIASVDRSPFLDMLGLNDLDQAWDYALLAADAMIDAFEYEPGRKVRFVERLANGFAKEFGMNAQLEKELRSKFSNHRLRVNRLFLEQDQINSFLAEVLRRKQERLFPVARQIRVLFDGGSMDQLLGSYLHMMVNRCFRSRQRKCELVLYSMLSQFYNTSGKYEKTVNTDRLRMA
ncbi:MAG: lantibiotic dehydratase [Lewinellaceae bacterium]|nr:lantibiotic dehydratase [Lewinellaceae bacterium]